MTLQDRIPRWIPLNDGLFAIVNTVDGGIDLTQRAREPVGERGVVFDYQDTHLTKSVIHKHLPTPSVTQRQFARAW